jgi:hypothetical protein
VGRIWGFYFELRFDHVEMQVQSDETTEFALQHSRSQRLNDSCCSCIDPAGEAAARHHVSCCSLWTEVRTGMLRSVAASARLI